MYARWRRCTEGQGIEQRSVAMGDAEVEVATRKSQMPGKQEPPRTPWGWCQLKYPAKGRENLLRPYPEVRPSPPLEEWGSPTHLQNFNPELLLSKWNTGTKSGAETEGKAIQRLPHLVIHTTCKHQAQTLLLMPWSDCWQESNTAFSWEALPDPDQYICRCIQPNIVLSLDTLMERVRAKTVGAEGVCDLIGRTISTNQNPIVPRD